MKILLDENLPRKLKADFGPDYEVKTVREMNWQGKKNGELLGLIAFNGFDIFVTVDKNLQHQQNLDKFNISIFLLLAINNMLLMHKIKRNNNENMLFWSGGCRGILRNPGN